jgi:CheY-like chemotaxis protein
LSCQNSAVLIHNQALHSPEVRGSNMPLVLIIDDEPVQRALIRETLAADPSLTFVEAADGSEGLQLARVHHPDVIVLDVQLPDLDGLAVCRALKADPELMTIPIVIVSAYHREVAAREAGCDAYVVRPFHTGTLEAIVHRLLGNTG